MKKYSVVYFKENAIVRSRVTGRAIDNTGNQVWKLSPTNAPEQPEHWIDNAQLIKFIANAKAVSNQSPPSKSIPSINAVRNFMPEVEGGWSFKKEGFVGMTAAVHLANCPHQKKNRNKKLLYEVSIDAKLTGPQGDQFWGRLTSDPATSVIFTSGTEVANATQAHDLLRCQKRKMMFFKKYATPATCPMPTEETDGDFLTGTVIHQATWHRSLDNIEKVAGSLDFKAMGAGVKVSSGGIYDRTEARVRRCYAFLLEQRNDHYHEAIPLLMESFWGMILSPNRDEEDKNANDAIHKRCKLFEQGNWEILWKQ
jgi:hypothetical protein